MLKSEKDLSKAINVFKDWYIWEKWIGNLYFIIKKDVFKEYLIKEKHIIKHYKELLKDDKMPEIEKAFPKLEKQNVIGKLTSICYKNDYMNYCLRLLLFKNGDENVNVFVDNRVVEIFLYTFGIEESYREITFKIQKDKIKKEVDYIENKYEQVILVMYKKDIIGLIMPYVFQDKTHYVARLKII